MTSIEERRTLPSWVLSLMAILGPLCIAFLYLELFDLVVRQSGAQGRAESTLGKISEAIFAAALLAFVIAGSRLGRTRTAAKTFLWISAPFSLLIFLVTIVGMWVG